jgi:hypothetical protein
MDRENRIRVDQSILAFVTAAKRLIKSPSQETAEDACTVCRSAVELFFFAREDYKDGAPEQVDALVNSLDDVENALKVLADQLGPDSHPSHYLDSVQRRKDLVHAVLANDEAKIDAILEEGMASVPSSTPLPD